VEDCTTRGGVRVHSMDVLSLCRSHVDLRDDDVQHMFNHFTHCSRSRMERWIAGFSESNASAHDRELQEFLCHLLDAAYFELDESGSDLQLRLPAFVEPPHSMPSEEHTLIEVERPQSPKSPLSARWIREKILVPRSAAQERATGGVSQCSRSQCSNSRSSQSRGPRAESPSAQRASSVYGTGSRRPRSARRASASTSRHEGAVGCMLSAPPMHMLRASEYATPHRPLHEDGAARGIPCQGQQTRSSSRAALLTENSVGSCNRREAAGAAAKRCSSGRSLQEASRHSIYSGLASPEASVQINPSASVTFSDGGEGSQSPRSTKHRVKAESSAERSEWETVRRPFSASSRELRAAAGAPCQAIRSRYTGDGGIRSFLRKSQSSRSSRGAAECKHEPVPPCEPRTCSGHGRPFPRGCADTASMRSALAVAPHKECAFEIQAPPPKQRLLRPTSAQATKHKRVADNHEKPTVYEDCEASGKPRLLRPTSAKATKHKRVADNHEKPTVYEDCEASEAGDCDETDALEVEVESHRGAPVSCMLSAPPKPMLTASERVTPPKPLLEAWPRASPVPSRSPRAMLAPAYGGGFLSDTCASEMLESTLLCVSNEPRVSSPPPRPPPRLVS
jgi:hypothetical protein